MTSSDSQILNLRSAGKRKNEKIASKLCYQTLLKCILIYSWQKDPFSDGTSGLADIGEKKTELNLGSGLVHIRIQQRNGRKTLTTVQGLESQFDKKKLVRAFKKEFACNGTVVEHPEYGEVIQLQGDQRNNVCQFLTKIGIVKETQLKVRIRRLYSLFKWQFFNFI